MASAKESTVDGIPVAMYGEMARLALAAIEADEAYQRALVMCYGRRMATEMRYTVASHDDPSVEAHKQRKIAADAAYLTARDTARNYQR